MNFTRIDNIKDKVKDWNQVGVEYLTKVFEFSSFEQGQAFVKSVSQFCNDKDHHPEWKTHNGGLKIEVKLTSHFMGNQLSLLDFEVAEHMNHSYKKVKSSFSQYPRFSSS